MCEKKGGARHHPFFVENSKVFLIFAPKNKNNTIQWLIFSLLP